MLNGTTTIQVRPLLAQPCPASSTLGRDAPYIVKDFFLFFLFFSRAKPVFTFCHVSRRHRRKKWPQNRITTSKTSCCVLTDPPRRDADYASWYGMEKSWKLCQPVARRKPRNVLSNLWIKSPEISPTFYLAWRALCVKLVFCLVQPAFVGYTVR